MKIIRSIISLLLPILTLITVIAIFEVTSQGKGASQMAFSIGNSLKKRQEKLGMLKTEYGINNRSNRQQLIEFVQDEKQMEGIDLNASYGNLEGSLLLVAAKMNDYDLFLLILEKGADLNHPSFNKLTPIDSIMIWASDIRFYELLDKRGYDFNTPTIIGSTPLSLVFVKIGYSDNSTDIAQLENIANFLIKKNVDINSNGIHMLTPLMAAARFQLIDQIQYLIDNGADKKQKYNVKDCDKEVDCLEYIDFLKERERFKKYDVLKTLLS